MVVDLHKGGVRPVTLDSTSTRGIGQSRTRILVPRQRRERESISLEVFRKRRRTSGQRSKDGPIQISICHSRMRLFINQGSRRGAKTPSFWYVFAAQREATSNGQAFLGL